MRWPSRVGDLRRSGPHPYTTHGTQRPSAPSSAGSAMQFGDSSRSTWSTADSGPGRTPRNDCEVQRDRLYILNGRLFGQVTSRTHHHATPTATGAASARPKKAS